MAAHGMGLVWSPRSNVFLYGARHRSLEDRRTSRRPSRRGSPSRSAPDWSIGGSRRTCSTSCASPTRSTTRSGATSSRRKTLVQMATKNAAKVFGLVHHARRAGGRPTRPTCVVIGGDRTQPYDALLAATPKDVRLVVVGGKVLYGDTALRPLAQTSPACDSLDICGVSKFACVSPVRRHDGRQARSSPTKTSGRPSSASSKVRRQEPHSVGFLAASSPR